MNFISCMAIYEKTERNGKKKFVSFEAPTNKLIAVMRNRFSVHIEFAHTNK